MSKIPARIDAAEDTDRQFVTALARGLDVLAAYRSGDRHLSNFEISRRTGLARPTVSRLTYTLMKTGHLLRDEASGEYRLSAKVLQLGFSSLAATSISDRAADGMTALSQGPNPNITVALAEQVGTRAVYLSVRRSRQAVSLSIDVGARLPLFYSGIGRAILAGMAEAEQLATLEVAIAEFPEQRERMEDSLKMLRADYERFGYCTSFGGWKPEINSIAAPVRALDGTTVYGINVGGPSFLVTPEELHEGYGAKLLALIDDLAPRS